jgi:hypothetical protein
MQPHEGEGPPDKPKQDKTTWWLMVVIFALLGMVIGQLIQRWI